MFEEHIFSLFICPDIQESHFGEVSYSTRQLSHVRPFATHSPAGFSVRGLLQARILECIVICFSRGSSNPGVEPVPPALQWILYCLKHQMVEWQHWLNRLEFQQTLGGSEGQGSLACCNSSLGSQRLRHDLGTEQQQQNHSALSRFLDGW